MEKTTGPSKAFALKSQYAPNICQAAQGAGVAPSDDEAEDGPGHKKRKLEDDGKEGPKKPVWDYNSHRKAFIKNVIC